MFIEDEWIDEELQKAGVRFTDETKVPAQIPETEKPAHVKAVNANWEPAESYPYHVNRLKGCVKWGLICAAISTLLCVFMSNDLMAAEAAIPCICICMILGGYGVGKRIGGKTHEAENG